MTDGLVELFISCFIIVLFSRNGSKNRSKDSTNQEDEMSSEIRPVISPTIDIFPVTENSRVELVNGRHLSNSRPVSVCLDPWIRRQDQPLANEPMVDPDNQCQQPIQYEIRPYYRSLSSTSDDFSPRQQSESHEQQQTKSSFNNNVDKDIEYVESRLRGQTTVSLPPQHSTSYTNEISWSKLSSNSRYANPLLSTSNHSHQEQQQTVQMHQTYSTTSNKPIVNDKISSKTLTTENVKTVKRRIEKLKDQKAAKTLRFSHHTSNGLRLDLFLLL